MRPEKPKADPASDETKLTRIVAMVEPEDLIELDSAAKEKGLSRAAFIRMTLKDALAARRKGDK